MPDWLVPILGLIGVIIGAGISEIRHWRENKERYQIMTFERRIITYQKALSLTYQLAKELKPYFAHDGKSEDIRNDLINTTEKIRDWWFNNCLLLDQHTRDAIIDNITAIQGRLELKKPLDFDVYEIIIETHNAITSGIGIKHLPKTSIK